MQLKIINRNDYTGNQVIANIIRRDTRFTEYAHGTFGVWSVTFEVYGMRFYLSGSGKQGERAYSLYELKNRKGHCVAQGCEFADGNVVMDSNGFERDGTGEDAALDAAIQLISNLY